MKLPEYVQEITAHIHSEIGPFTPDAAVILGSGLGSFSESLSDLRSIPYTALPHFPGSTVAGHEGRLLFGALEDLQVMAFSGRFHHYEGYPLSRTILPVQLSHAMSAKKLIISNAAGGINFSFRVGDLMIIDGIIRQNMMLSDPAPHTWKWNLDKWAEKAKKLADRAGIPTQRGNYLYVKGPNYETRSEIRAFRKLGGDAVGMSTAPELMEASRLGLKTTAISLITNAAAGVTGEKLDHAEVKEAAELKKEEFAELVQLLIRDL